MAQQKALYFRFVFISIIWAVLLSLVLVLFVPFSAKHTNFFRKKSLRRYVLTLIVSSNGLLASGACFFPIDSSFLTYFKQVSVFLGSFLFLSEAYSSRVVRLLQDCWF